MLFYHRALGTFRIHTTLLLLACGACAVWGQQAWPVDSLLTTWPVHTRLADARQRPRAGADPSTADLYTALRRIAPAFPVFADSLVHHYIATFSGARQDHFRAVLGMAEVHGDLIERELARHGLPAELKYLPLALSAMNTQAASNTGEAGLWMLNWAVALRHGLEVDAEVDERRDPGKSTRAAMRHLQELQGHYGDWPTAVMAFACGPANLTRAIKRSGGDTDPRLIYRHMSASHREVLPRLMAFTYLAAQADRLGIQPMAFRQLEPSDTLRHDSTLQIDALTRVVGTRRTRFHALNPTFTGPSIRAGMPFLLPHSEAERFHDLAFVVLEAQSSRPRIPGGERPAGEAIERLEDGREAILYRITTEDCINCIAERFATSVADIKTWNDLAGDELEVGNTLVLFVSPEERLKYESTTPGPGGLPADSLSGGQRPPPTRQAPSGPDFSWHTVRKGDSLYLIAKRYPGISADDLMRFNDIGPDIRPGQRIKIPKR